MNYKTTYFNISINYGVSLREDQMDNVNISHPTCSKDLELKIDKFINHYEENILNKVFHLLDEINKKNYSYYFNRFKELFEEYRSDGSLKRFAEELKGLQSFFLFNEEDIKSQYKSIYKDLGDYFVKIVLGYEYVAYFENNQRFTPEHSKQLELHLNEISEQGWKLVSMSPVSKGVTNYKHNNYSGYGYGYNLLEGYVITWESIKFIQESK